MPCKDDRDLFPEESSKANLELKERLDNVTAILCDLCRKIELDKNLHYLFGDKLYGWWKQHKREDEARTRQEEIAKKTKAALDKLTNEEKMLLGLK